jgi:hypothetical protein
MQTLCNTAAADPPSKSNKASCPRGWRSHGGHIIAVHSSPAKAERALCNQRVVKHPSSPSRLS